MEELPACPWGCRAGSREGTLVGGSCWGLLREKVFAGGCRSGSWPEGPGVMGTGEEEVPVGMCVGGRALGGQGLEWWEQLYQHHVHGLLSGHQEDFRISPRSLSVLVARNDFVLNILLDGNAMETWGRFHLFSH